MPEEINRRLTDHLSKLLFCPTPTAVRNLRREGINRGVSHVGDVMMDAIRQNLARARRARPVIDLPHRGFYLATLHRQENVDDPERLMAVMEALASLPWPTVLPAHPRTRDRLRRLGLRPGGAVHVVEPQPYLQMLLLQSRARAVLTDSGGMQKEAFILGTPCVTLRDRTEWVETLRGGANRLAGADSGRILRAVRAVERNPPRPGSSRVYGDGKAAEAIARAVHRFLSSRKQ
jgi:UDP-N-acetylglucosamine 2-epimerase